MESIQNVTKVFKAALETMGYIVEANFIIGILLEGVITQLWGMIRALQMMVLSVIINVPQLPHVSSFYDIIIELATMDIFHGEDLMAMLWNFKETSMLSTQFDLFGMGDKNMFYNSGSFFVFLALGFVLAFIACIINFVTSRCNSYKRCRRVGYWVYSSGIISKFQAYYTKLFLESYLDMGLCTLANILAIFGGTDGPFSSYF